MQILEAQGVTAPVPLRSLILDLASTPFQLTGTPVEDFLASSSTSDPHRWGLFRLPYLLLPSRHALMP
jgi:hypothetical protein